MKNFFFCIMLAVAASFAVGCGGSSSSKSSSASSATLTSGNYYAVVNSQVGALLSANNDPYPYEVPLRGAVTVTSGAVTAQLVPYDTVTGAAKGVPCFPIALNLVGTNTNGAVALAPPSVQSSLAITASVEPTSILLGSYTCNSTTLGADQGTVYATLVPSLAGTWAGTMADENAASSGIPSTTISAAVTQDSTPIPSATSAFPAGAFVLRGTITLTNTLCFGSKPVSWSIDATQSYVNGELVTLYAYSTDFSSEFFWSGALNDPTTAATMTGRIQNPPQLIGACNATLVDPSYTASNPVRAQLSKQ